MRKIKNAKKKKKEVIEIPDSVMKKIMEILKKLCNDEDKFTLISYLINSNYHDFKSNLRRLLLKYRFYFLISLLFHK